MRGFLARHPLAAPVLVALLLRYGAAQGVDRRLEAEGRPFVAGRAVEEGTHVAMLASLFGAWDAGARRAVEERPMGFPLALVPPYLLGDWLDAGDAPGEFTRWFLRLSVVPWGVLAVWATGRLGRAVGGERVGLCAAWLAAVNPLAVLYGGLLTSESMFAALATVSLWGVARCVRREPGDGPAPSRWRPAVWGGLAAAGATLVRPGWVAFAPLVVLLAVGLAWRSSAAFLEGRASPGGGASAGWAWAFGLAFLVGFAPRPLWNLAEFGEPILTTPRTGVHLYDGLGPQATGASDLRFREEAGKDGLDLIGWQIGPREWAAVRLGRVPPPERAVLVGLYRAYQSEWRANPSDGPGGYFAAIDRALAGGGRERLRAARLNEGQSGRAYARAALAAAAADPGRVFRLAVVKQGRFWRPWPIDLLPDGAVGTSLKAAIAVFFLSLVGLAAWGGIMLGRGIEPGMQAPAASPPNGSDEEPTRADGRSSRSGLTPVWAVALTWGPVLGLAAGFAVFVGDAGDRLPGEFPLCVAAAVGLLDLRGRWIARGADAHRSPTRGGAGP